MDERGRHGRARELRLPGALFGLGALALAGLSPFGTGLDKTVAEEVAGRELGRLPAVFGLVSALTGGAAPAVPAASAPETWWTTSGIGLGLLSALIAVDFAVAAAAVRRDPRRGTGGPYRTTVRPLRRLHSGLLGDYVAWLAVGLTALLVALTAQL
ncbi:hypothetical protein ACFWNL_14565 [Kitasatospora sp. NPDC058397]|uniref:hypothetical protein n=1 Tax=unclassified Kitasatospora TaxID=2633591 RepID=UPI0036507DBE